MYVRKYITLFLLLISISLFAQNAEYVNEQKAKLVDASGIVDSAHILCEITWNIGYDSAEASLNYGKLANKLALTTTDSVLIAKSHDALAMGLRLNGYEGKAISNYKISVDISNRHNIHEVAAWSYWNLMNIELKRNNKAEAVYYGRNSSLNFEKANMPLMALSCLVDLKNNNYYQHTDSIIIKGDYYLENFEMSTDDRLFMNITVSRLYSSIENEKKAMQYITEAMNIADNTQNIKGLHKVYYVIAEYLKDKAKNYEISLEYYSKMIEMQKAKGIEPIDLYVAAGDIHRLMNNTDTAKYYFELGIENAKAAKCNHSISIGYMKMGELYYQVEDYDSAISNYLISYETGCGNCPEIKFHNVLISLGKAYLIKGNELKAIDSFEKSIALADSAKDSRTLSISYQAISDFYYKKQQLIEAGKYGELAYEYSRKVDFLEGQRNSAEILYMIYKDKSEYKKAVEFLEIEKAISDSLHVISQADNLSDLETYLDFENIQMQRDLEEAKANEEIRTHKLLRNFFVIGFALVSLLVVVILVGYRRKNKDNALLQKQKQEIKQMADKVHKGDQAKLDFFTNISHEFRTPLTIILGYINKLSRSTNIEGIESIRKNSSKLLQLVNNLLDLRKLDVYEVGLNVLQTNLAEFVKGIVNLFNDLAENKNIDISCMCDLKSADHYIDKEKVEKVLCNLLSNSIKYTNDSGSIELSVTENNSGTVCIVVKDSGIGIPEKDLPNIFNRFYRVSESESNGTGIGLALIKELVELHKGSIEVESKEGVGSEFAIIIPTAREFYLNSEMAELDIETEVESYIYSLETNDTMPLVAEPDINQKSILIVEDNADLRNYVAGLFVNDFSIIQAKNGRQGVKLALEHIPDIIISDIMMPELNGFELTEQIKNDQRTSHIPVILLTAKNDVAARITGYNKGADEYIEKPFDSDVLKSRVNSLLRIRMQLVERFSNSFDLQPREIKIEDADQKFLKSVIDVIEKYISEPELNIDLICEEICISRTQLYRKLKALTDYSANKFIRIIRLKRAAQILEHGQNNIAEVMDATGFSNYSHFNNCFKEYFGEYPKDYMLLNVKGSVN